MGSSLPHPCALYEGLAWGGPLTRSPALGDFPRGSPIWPAWPGSGRGRRSAGVGVPEEDARSCLRGGLASKAEGWGSGVGCALPL